LLAVAVAMPFDASGARILLGMAEPKLYDWSVTIAACNQKSRTFQDLAEKLKINVHQLMKECNGKVAPSKAIVKGLARELDLSESMLDRLAEEVRKDLGAK
jgi:transcriptional regulator with XRE-family HTH domain